MNPSSYLQRSPLSGKRDVEDVPFVELFGSRLQGVVSSGSDPNRVYVSWVEAGTLNYYCSTNNNRPCGGLRGSPCKHILGMVEQAALQYGIERTVRFLKLPNPAAHYEQRGALAAAIRGTQQNEPASMVFSRFLTYLRYCELQPPAEHCREMLWFT